MATKRLSPAMQLPKTSQGSKGARYLRELTRISFQRLNKATGSLGGRVNGGTGSTGNSGRGEALSSAVEAVEETQAPVGRASKKVLILMSDTGGGHRASAQVPVDPRPPLLPRSLRRS